MRNEIFSFPRFAQLVRYEVLTRRKSLGYFALGSYAGLLAAYLGVNAASNNFDIFTRGAYMATIIFILIYLCIYGASILSPTRQKGDVTNLLMLPATQLEKFVVRFLAVTVGLVAIACVNIVLADLSRVVVIRLFDNTEEFRHIAFDQFFSSLLSTHSVTIQDNATNINLTPFTLLWFQSLYIIGGCLWQTKKAQRTTVSWVILLWGSILLLTIMGAETSIDLLLNEVKDTNSIGQLAVGTEILLILFILLNWGIAYRLFCIMQIKERSFIKLPKFFRK